MAPNRASQSTAYSSIEDRRAEKRRARRRLWLIRGAIAAGVVAALAALMWMVAFSPVLALHSDRVEIDGAQSTADPDATSRAVAEAVSPYGGTPLIRVPLSDVEAALRQSPHIQDVQVKRKWPSGLDVRITPRVPSMMQQGESGTELLGADGQLLGVIAEPFPGIPNVQLASYGTGDPTREAEAVMEVWSSMTEGLKSQVSLISVSGGDVTLTLTSGAQVLWGDKDSSPLKAQVLEVLVSNREASVYDVMDPAHPSTR